MLLHTYWYRIRNCSPRQIACVVFWVMCVLWSQLLYPLALDTKTLFEAIIDSHDQAALDSTYDKWLKGLFSQQVCGFLRDGIGSDGRKRLLVVLP